MANTEKMTFVEMLHNHKLDSNIVKPETAKSLLSLTKDGRVQSNAHFCNAIIEANIDVVGSITVEYLTLDIVKHYGITVTGNSNGNSIRQKLTDIAKYRGLTFANSRQRRESVEQVKTNTEKAVTAKKDGETIDSIAGLIEDGFDTDKLSRRFGKDLVAKALAQYAERQLNDVIAYVKRKAITLEMLTEKFGK